MGFDRRLKTRSESRNGVARIALSGELDLATAPYLAIQLEPFQSNGVSAIVLDLGEVTFIDSSGLHALVRASKRAKANGKPLILIGTRPSARRVIEITGTDFLLEDQDDFGVLRRFARP